MNCECYSVLVYIMCIIRFLMYSQANSAQDTKFQMTYEPYSFKPQNMNKDLKQFFFKYKYLIGPLPVSANARIDM